MMTDSYWPNGHPFSPVPSAEDVARALAWREACAVDAIAGVALDVDAMWQRADLLARALGPFRLRERAGGGRLYGTANERFNAADAGVATAMVAAARPRRIVEVGSGDSTAALLDARDAFRIPLRLITIDPDPSRLFDLVGSGARPRFHLLALDVQRVGLEPFLALEAGDILFTDSSHVAKAGSDVLHLFFEILPRLAPGVLVHLHDVMPGFEYPSEWLTAGRYWNEAYLLRAFLIGNRDCRVELWPGLLAEQDPERFHRTFPIAAGTVGGSVWLRIVRRSAAVEHAT